MNHKERFAIIGGGIAGVTAADTLRIEGFEGEIVIIDEDDNSPYDRPPLSKNFIYQNNEMKDYNLLFRQPDFYSKKNIDLELGKRVNDIDVKKKMVILENGTSIEWDKLLIATGSKARELNVPGIELLGVHYLKDLESAYHLRDVLVRTRKLVIIGAGFIGLEVAASCRKLGIDVTVIEVMQVPLAHAVGADIGKFLVELHQSNGVNIVTENVVKEIRETSLGMEVLTENGNSFECDAVLACIGTVADNRLLLESGLESRLSVNHFGETKIPDVFAAGDCTFWNYFIEGQEVRVEHWDHAVNHGKTVAKNMVKPNREEYRIIPYFWSDQYDGKLQYVGHPLTWERTVMRGSIDGNKFTIFMIRNERMVGALSWNDPSSVLPSRRLIERKVVVNDEDLIDPNIKLKKLVPKT